MKVSVLNHVSCVTVNRLHKAPTVRPPKRKEWKPVRQVQLKLIFCRTDYQPLPWRPETNVLRESVLLEELKTFKLIRCYCTCLLPPFFSMCHPDTSSHAASSWAKTPGGSDSQRAAGWDWSHVTETADGPGSLNSASPERRH